MTKDISLNSMFTPWTIDTYQTFTMDNEEENIIQDRSDYDENGKEREVPLVLTYDDFDWDYDHKGFVQALADRRLEVLQDHILDDVILAIKADGLATSPKYYNYYTDSVNNIFTVDMDKLNKYIEDSKHYCENDDDKLIYYLKNKSGEEYGKFEDYYYDMVEGIDCMEFISAKLIKKE